MEGCRSLVKGFAIKNEPADADDQAEDLSYFASYESCYAFLAEASLEELQEDARQLGLDPAGKDKYEIAKMMFRTRRAEPPDGKEG
jgi:hypothetical protein